MLVVSDALAGSVVMGIALGEGASWFGAAIVVPFMLLVSKAMGLYDRDEHLLNKTTLDEVPRIFQVVALTALAFSVTDGLMVEAELRGLGILVGGVLLFGLMSAGRLGARRIARALSPSERCLVIGEEPAVTWLRTKLKTSSVPTTFIGYVPMLSQGHHIDIQPPEDETMLGGLETLAHILATRDVDRVIIAPGAADPEVVVATIRLIKALGVRTSVLPGLFEVIGSSMEFDSLDGMTLLGLRRFELSHSSRALKRSGDLVGAAALLIVLSPVLALLGLMVKLTSPGPVLFRQWRAGRDGIKFRMIKFRTMFEGAEERQRELVALNEADGFFKISDDPRVTSVGRLLRRTSIDELPQLLNVIRGEMSLVGPRPLPLHEDGLIEGWERSRLNLTPGMTGLWQIFGSSRIPMREMVKIDYLYCASWSPWFDVKILLRTVSYVLRGRGR